MMEKNYEYSAVSTALGQKPEPVKIWRQYLIAFVANMSVAVAGYTMVWTSPVLAKFDDPKQSPLPYPLSEYEKAWIGSLLSLGAILGPFIGGPIASKLGRKWALLISMAPLFLGLILVLMVKSVIYLYIARTVWGAAGGMVFTILPMYNSEIATVDARGALGSFLATFVCMGYLVMYVVGPFVSYNMVAYFGIIFGLFFIGTFSFMPETPKYLLMKNRREAAAASLMTLRGMSRAGVEPELVELTEEIKDSSDNSASIFEVLKQMTSGGNFKGFYISCVLISAQQFSGINAVLFYLSIIFAKAGSSMHPDIASIISGSVLFLSCCATSVAVEKFGRKTLLMISSIGCTFGLSLLGIYFYLDYQHSPWAKTLSFLPLLSMVVYIVTYCCGLGPLPWVYLSELLPMEVKSVASPAATAYCWVLSFIVTRYFSALSDLIGGHGVFWLFAACCALSFLFSLFVVPETKGKTALEIKDLLAGRQSSNGKV